MAKQFQSPEEVVRVAKIIAFAMILGALTFAGIAWFIAQQMNRGGDQDQLISLIMAATSLPELFIFFFVSNFMSAERMEQRPGYNPTWSTPEMKPYHIKLTHIIVQYALLQGACVMNIVAYIIEQNWWSLGIASVFLLFMLSNFPSETRFKHYAETQQTYS
ncbi:MAG: hypothetical protein HON04_18855 [Planctomicrobium sp.]|nr:hypothetical protein [Planctomicrobium sp.]